MGRNRRRRGLIITATAVAVLSFGILGGSASAHAGSARDGAAAAQAPGGDGPRKPGLALRVNGLRKGKVKLYRRVEARVRIFPFVAGEEVELRVFRRGRRAIQRRLEARKDGASGLATMKFRILRGGQWKVEASHPASASLGQGSADPVRFKVRFPALRRGARGKSVKLFHKLLRMRGYPAPRSGRVNSSTSRAVLAFRKVNGMGRSGRATSRVFKKLDRGGEFKLRHPRAGRHVEVDLSRQVLVLATKRGPFRTYHASSGARSTPSDKGKFRFYRREPGFNSLRMFYSVYYNGGEAIHGYSSVPNHPASHGCIRLPMANAIFIYRWVSIGMPIWVYR